MRFDGTDRRTHLSVTGKNGYSPNMPDSADDIIVRPDGRWALALVTDQLYLLALPRFGGEATQGLGSRGDRSPQEAHRCRSRLRRLGRRRQDDHLGRRLELLSPPVRFGRLRPAEEPKRPKRRRTRTRPPREKKEQKPKPEELAVVVERPRSRPRGTIVFKGAKIITMRADEIIPEGEIVVTDNRITSVGAEGSAKVPEGAHVVDASKMTIVPGFVDTHAHWRVRRSVLDLADMELLRQPRLRRDDRSRPADRHERHVRVSRLDRHRRAGRPAGVFNRAGRLFQHRLPVGRRGSRRWSLATRSITARTRSSRT